MNRMPIPLAGPSPEHVALPRAPLVRVIAQVKYPTILAINDQRRVANFQEKIRKTYPILEQVQGSQLAISAGVAMPNIQERTVWRFSDRAGEYSWRVSLAPEFVALETTTYERRHDFLDRFRTVVNGLADTFEPTTVQRFGMRYIDRVQGAAFAQLDKLIQTKALGILQDGDQPGSRLGRAVVHSLTQAEIVAEEGNIQARWGALPAGGTYDPNNVEAINEPSWVLDLDMFTTEAHAFSSNELMTTADKFSDRIYDVFRQMVTPAFLEFYGGKA